ncbi:MAG TPA: DUF6531 domain-containing protein, partial [Woeseiaceae bacterium]|nr:DUF6531 domain-containing protein [Woeseiaceae bacterium]
MNRTTCLSNVLLVFALLSSGSAALAQTFPASCKPVGSQNCEAAIAKAYEYKMQTCEAAYTYPSEAEAAAAVLSQMYTSPPGCPATEAEFLRWADNETRIASGGVPDPDFHILCPGEGSGPYPLIQSGHDVANYSLYQLTTYSAPTCDANVYEKPMGLVYRTSGVICPEGYQFGGSIPDRYCYRNDSDVDMGKNLGCPDKTLGQCVAGNPINTGTGNKYQVETDFTGTGENPLVFRRYYNSLAGLNAAANGVHRFSSTNSAPPALAFMDPDQQPITKAIAADSIGVNWRHTYQRGVAENADSVLRSAMLYRQDGRVLVLNEYNGSWISDDDVQYGLTELTDGGETTGWQVKTPADATETYNAAGQLLTIANRAGVVTAVLYDSVGRIDKVVDQFGRELDFGYASEPEPGVEWWEDQTAINQIRTITDPLGNVYTYNYNSNGTLESVTYPDTNVRQYKYEDPSFPFALTAIIDGNLDQFATFGYDSSGRANLSYHGQGAEISQRVDVTYTKTTTFAPYFSIASNVVTYGQGAAGSFSTSSQIGRQLGVSKMNSMTHGSNSEGRTYDV